MADLGIRLVNKSPGLFWVLSNCDLKSNPRRWTEPARKHFRELIVQLPRKKMVDSALQCFLDSFAAAML